MKYGESGFDVLYLLFAVLGGCFLLRRAKDGTEKKMGLAALILGLGDAFHLVPRVLNYFIDADFNAALGVGKFVTSVTMTLFYLLLYSVWLGFYEEKENRTLTKALWALALLRVGLCLFPQNGWIENKGSLTWGILRNVPFVILGAAVCLLYFRKRSGDRAFRFMWLYVLLSFAFYIPVVIGAEKVPMLGMLMLPKTICYILMIVSFLRAVTAKTRKEKL